MFQIKWLIDERFKLWLRSDKKSNEATCRLFNSIINVAKIGMVPYSSWTREKSQGNSEFVSPTSIRFFQINLSTQKNAALSVKRPASILDNLVISVSSAKTEIRLALEVIESNLSLGSCLDLNNLFQLVFPDSTIGL